MAKGLAEGKAEGRAEGRSEGRAEGRAEGREEGEAIGEANNTARLTAKRFADCPAEILDIIRSSTDRTFLDRVGEALFSASSLEGFMQTVGLKS